MVFKIAEEYPNELIIWSCIDAKSNLNISKFPDIFHHNKIMASFNPFQNPFLPEGIGYIEESPFIKINKEVTYPTWQMSSYVGGIHASVLIALKTAFIETKNFDYFLNSISKLAMSEGLLCYSEPKLIIGFPNITQNQTSNTFVLFRFVKQHYKTRWIFLLLLNLFLYERKMALLPFISSLFYFKRKLKKNVFDEIRIKSEKKVIESGTIDILIPTIGRREYLKDVLLDLSLQTYLPKNVIIVEQNPDLEKVSDLDYITTESWPFTIKHIFTHQPGACNARNLAMAEVKSEWVFMADDDIRLESLFLEEAFSVIEKDGAEQITFGCYAPNYPQNTKLKQKAQWGSFGSGCSIVKSENIKNISYNPGFEFGYGEDTDFGMQLRNSGHDVLYAPKPEILHLKAPMGGFRTKPVLAWQNDPVQPKPSPTVMLYKILNLSKQQIEGYKTVLFFKFYKAQAIKNPFLYLSTFKKQWKQSMYWANELKNKK
ncbi:glycosyltransferase family 2 protein [Flavobacterium chryseum]|uniref:glycosyltransferase family 2 protein n=1 Tax=Flavobacterium sp. P3160 TaxID=2512113 RepID=UPI001FB5D008|nr:glycosyltransferase [Flavobacterium sp. P3160]